MDIEDNIFKDMVVNDYSLPGYNDRVELFWDIFFSELVIEELPSMELVSW